MTFTHSSLTITQLKLITCPPDNQIARNVSPACALNRLMLGSPMKKSDFHRSNRPRKALNIIRITPRSSALYAILYGKIVLAQYRTQGFSTLMRVVGIFRHWQRLCALMCSCSKSSHKHKFCQSKNGQRRP